MRDIAYVLYEFIYTKLFWYDREQGNNRCVCLSHLFYDLMLFYGWVGYFYPIHKISH